ncbi:hypothetical protein UlMin_037891 [Ulmus minor]
MEVTWRPLLSLSIVSALIIHEEWVSAPSCTIISGSNLEAFVEEQPEDLKVMMVPNLLLMGSNTSYLNSLFKDHYMSKFYKKSFQSLDPDMLVVLGDVSAKGSELTKMKWLSSKSVSWIARRFIGLDSAGCGAFEISNVRFLSLNAVALLCGNNNLGFASKIFLPFLSLSRENFHHYYFSLAVEYIELAGSGMLANVGALHSMGWRAAFPKYFELIGARTWHVHRAQDDGRARNDSRAHSLERK